MFVLNYNISKAKLIIYNTTATLLQNNCEQINVKTKELYSFALVCVKIYLKK